MADELAWQKFVDSQDKWYLPTMVAPSDWRYGDDDSNAYVMIENTRVGLDAFLCHNFARLGLKPPTH